MALHTCYIHGGKGWDIGKEENDSFCNKKLAEDKLELFHFF